MEDIYKENWAEYCISEFFFIEIVNQEQEKKTAGH